MFDSGELSAYEHQRAENIRQNQLALAALGLAPGDGIVPKTKAALPPAKRRKQDHQRPQAQPERKSSRLEGAKAPDYFIASESAKGEITLGGEQREGLKVAREQHDAAMDPLSIFGLGGMPEGESELLEGEMPAFEALREVKRQKASELQIEGYKIAQHRSLCELARRLPESIADLRLCWGFGGSGVRVDKYGEMFLGALKPFIEATRAVHQAAKTEYDAKVAAEGSGATGEADTEATAAVAEAEVAARALASRAREIKAARDGARTGTDVLPSMPEKAVDLTATERRAYDALLAATHVRAEEIGERWVWNIAMVRSLCEMVRRVPTTDTELRLCWGFGGAGVRVERHGAFLLEALRPFVDELNSAQQRGASAAPRTDSDDDDEEEDTPLSDRAAAVTKTKREQRRAAPPPLSVPQAPLPPSASKSRGKNSRAANKSLDEEAEPRSTRATTRAATKCKARI